LPILFEEVKYVYDPRTPFEKEALNNINLKISEGEFVTILGKTGSGKSTLLQLMNGILKPSSGTVSVDKILTSRNDDSIFNIRRRVGLVFQYPEHQFFEENVFKEIAFGPKNFGVEANELNRVVLEAVEMVGLPRTVLSKSPFNLSGGEKRKVAIASVISCNPKYLVFDEPTSGLDPVSVNLFFDMVKRFRKFGKTIIIVTHSVKEAIQNSERIIVMTKGQIVFDGDIQTFIKSKKLIEWGMLPPPLYRLAWKIKEKVDDFDIKDDRLSEAVSLLKSMIN